MYVCKKKNKKKKNKTAHMSNFNQSTRRLKAIPWDAWARERSIGMNCEVK